MHKLAKFLLALFILSVQNRTALAQSITRLDSAAIDSVTIADSVFVDSSLVKQDSTILLSPDSLNESTRDTKVSPPTLSSQSALSTPAYRKIVNNAWDVGERLNFIIRYGPIVAGEATMAVVETTRVNENLCYHIRTEARSNKFFSAFFKVRDVAESFIDVNGLFSWRFEKHLREGKYRADKRTDYDQVNNLAITGKDTLAVPPFIQDVLSTLYYLRAQNYKVGDILSVQNYSDKRVYDLKVKIHRRERIRVRAGTFNCIVVEPFLVEGGGIFKHEGRIIIWISDDERHIPVQMKSKVFIGSVTAELEKIEGVGKT